jgi:hypothetical protein
MQRPPTGWAVAKQTRDGTPTPDDVGVPIYIAIVLICVKTIIMMLY